MSYAMAIFLSLVAVLVCFMYSYIVAMSQCIDGAWSMVAFYAAIYLVLHTALSLGIPLP